MRCKFCGQEMEKTMIGEHYNFRDCANYLQAELSRLQSELNDLVSERNSLRVELHTLRFKESQEQRFIWWVREVFAKKVQDTVYGIIEACTYQDEPTAAAGKYGLPIKCFEMMRSLTESTYGIYDGTYLDVEISTDAKTSTDNNKLDIHTLEYAAKWIENSLVGETNERVIEFGKNMAMSIRAAKPSISDVSMTRDVSTDVKTPPSIENTNPDYYKQEIARRDEIITRLKEDAERLAVTLSDEECCRPHGKWLDLHADHDEHSSDCPLVLHRQLMAEINGEPNCTMEEK